MRSEGLHARRDCCGVPVLQHCAVASPHPKRKQVTELLLRKGANINEKNKE